MSALNLLRESDLDVPKAVAALVSQSRTQSFLQFFLVGFQNFVAFLQPFWCLAIQCLLIFAPFLLHFCQTGDSTVDRSTITVLLIVEVHRSRALLGRVGESTPFAKGT